jgi:hypothetical protein
MKGVIARGSMLACLALMSGPAMAGYFGLSLGQNTIKDWDEVGPALDDGSFTSQTSDDSDTGFRVFGGFGSNENFSFEIGYSDFGEATFEAQSNGCCFYPAGPVKATASTTGIDLGGVGRAPISESVAIIGRLGLLLWEADVDATVSGGSGSESEDGNDVFFGVGLEFTTSPAMSLRAEFTRYSLDDLDLDSLSLSLVFRGGS